MIRSFLQKIKEYRNKTRKRNCMKKIPRKNPLTKGKMTRRNIKNFMKGCMGKNEA